MRLLVLPILCFDSRSRLINRFTTLSPQVLFVQILFFIWNRLNLFMSNQEFVEFLNKTCLEYSKMWGKRWKKKRRKLIPKKKSWWLYCEKGTSKHSNKSKYFVFLINYSPCKINSEVTALKTWSFFVSVIHLMMVYINFDYNISISENLMLAVSHFKYWINSCISIYFVILPIFLFEPKIFAALHYNCYYHILSKPYHLTLS